MPGIAHHCLRMVFPAHPYGKPVSPFLEQDAADGGCQSYVSGAGQRLSADDMPGLGQTRAEDHHSHSQQRCADDGRCQSLVLTMTIAMVLVHWLTAETHKEKHHHIGNEISERMHGIRNHGCRMSEESCSKLSQEEHHIDDAASDGHSVYFPFPVHKCISLLCIKVCFSVRTCPDGYNQASGMNCPKETGHTAWPAHGKMR